MFCTLNSYCLNGIDPLPIHVEIDLQEGLPGFDIVGLPDSAVKEAKNRVKSAIKNSGFSFPICHITVNLSPADIRKEGSLYDLPIALGILACLEQIPRDTLNDTVYIGELALDGTLRGVRGLLPLLCTDPSLKLTYVVPLDNQKEANLIQTHTIHLATHLTQVVASIKGDLSLASCSPQVFQHGSASTLDYVDVKGQETAKRALMLCAAGYHNSILIGPPGSGKTMLAQRLPSILSPLTESECIEVTKLYSIANQLNQCEIITERPFRAPHHTISHLGLTGGGAHPKPGEISLSHHGVLFLDELLEFDKQGLDLLRQPLENHQITLSRAQFSVNYPANFLFLAATNPCPCGHYPNTHKCSCSLQSIKKYLSKLSGPLVDRLDIHIETHVPHFSELHQSNSLSSIEMYAKIQQAHQIQKERFKELSIRYNSQIPSPLLSKFCPITPDGQQLLTQWCEHTSASIRVYDKILRIARTICDLESIEKLDTPHIAEAISYRILDTPFWTQ